MNLPLFLFVVLLPVASDNCLESMNPFFFFDQNLESMNSLDRILHTSILRIQT